MTGTGRRSPSRSAPRRRSRRQERCRGAPGRPPAGTAAPPRGRYSTPRKGRCPPRWRNRSPPPTSFRPGSAGRSPARSGAHCSRRRRPARPRPPPRGWSRARSRSDRARCSRTPVVHRRPTRRPRAREIQRRPQERKSGPVSSSSLPKRAATPPTRGLRLRVGARPPGDASTRTGQSSQRWRSAATRKSPCRQGRPCSEVNGFRCHARPLDQRTLPAEQPVLR